LENNPFFSIILPVFNRENRINRAIQSVLDQEFNNWELIIVNDASTDGTKEILDKIDNPQIRVIHNEENSERCVSRNIGIEHAKGEFICFLDSDDYHLPFHLSKFYDLIKSRNFEKAFYFSNAYNETESGERSDRFCPNFDANKPYHYFLNFTVNPQRWAIHKSIFEQVQFDPEVIICEDMDTSMRIVATGIPVFQLQERTTVYVAASDSFTHGDSKKWEKELFYLKRIFKKKEFQGKLPIFSKFRLLSMCYYHLAVKSNQLNQKFPTLKYGLKSFMLSPMGYNGKTLKPLLVILGYNIPILGFCAKKIIQFCKQGSFRAHIG
jgi:glycosyltransferase involved in cell wall biosynthesis